MPCHLVVVSFCFQIDDTDAMEDVHSLLTDVPPPSGTQQASSEIKLVCISALVPICKSFLFSYLVIQSFIVFEMGSHVSQAGIELSI